uniref:Uncharacterized protein n=1 Tax=Rhodogorgon sp. TaxID=2485824 RepID=A0A3G3MIC7_9FLOR|nr:hypothetical protein [Rhodogorgon sp.]
MVKYFTFLITLLNPFGFIRPDASIQLYVSRPSMVAMAHAPGDLPSKMANSAATPSEGCRQTTQVQYHGDGPRTETRTIACSSKRKIDKEGKVVRQSDTSKKKFTNAIEDFKNFSSGAGPSGQ